MFSFIATHVNGHFYSCVQKGWRSNFPCGSGVFGYTSHQFEFHTRIIIQCATNCNLSEIYFCAYFDLEFADALIVTFNLYYLHYLFFSILLFQINIILIRFCQALSLLLEWVWDNMKSC